jgi:phage terminase large subunit GpA-like protein
MDSKRPWNMRGKYAPKDAKISKSGKVEYEKGRRMVFWWDSLVSPFRKFQRIWDEYKDTKDRPEDYKNFIQCWLAQFWKEGKSKATIDELKLHQRDYYTVGEIPKGVQFLIGGIDTQDDALYIAIFGMGLGMKTWLIDEDRIPCDITTTNEEDLYSIIKSNVIDRKYHDADSNAWQVGLVAWDSGGHRTKEIYSVVKKFPQVIAIKGRNVQMRSISYSKKETHYNIRTIEYLEETEDRAAKDNFNLPENVSLEFMVQFAAKKKLITPNKRTGQPKVEWINRGADHFRMASCYAFSCLDIQIKNIGTLRSRLKDPNFIYNPLKAEPRQKGQARSGRPRSPAAKYNSYHY